MKKNLKTFRDHLEEEKQRIENERHRKKMRKDSWKRVWMTSGTSSERMTY